MKLFSLKLLIEKLKAIVCLVFSCKFFDRKKMKRPAYYFLLFLCLLRLLLLVGVLLDHDLDAAVLRES